MTRGTYSFIVCRLCRFPLRVRYMPRSISGGPPHPGAREGMQEAPLGSCLPPRPGRRRAATVRAAAEQSLRSQPEDWTPRHRLGWDSDRRSQEMGGTRTGSEKKKISLLANPDRDPVKGACVCKGWPLGPAQAGSQTQLFVTGLPRYHGSTRGRRRKQVSKLLGGKKRGRERRLCIQGGRAGYF